MLLSEHVCDTQDDSPSPSLVVEHYMLFLEHVFCDTELGVYVCGVEWWFLYPLLLRALSLGTVDLVLRVVAVVLVVLVLVVVVVV